MATKTTASKKLALTKETLRQLAAKDLKGVQGGTNTLAYPTYDCAAYPTYDCAATR
jgi:hypothetical protein